MAILKSKNKNFINIKDIFEQKNIDINKIVVSDKVSFGKKGFKYFIGYKEAKRIRLLCIFPPKMSAYRQVSDKTKYVFFNKR